VLTKQLIKGLALFLVCLIVDQASKELSLNFNLASENPGFIFGLASDLPSSLRVIGLSSIFGFLFFAYLLLMYFLPLQLLKLKMGLSFLCGGIFGNVVDRVFRGTSLDFIPLPVPFIDGQILFNLADVFQWVGAGLILYNVIVHEEIIWYPENQRGRYLIHPKEQIRFSIKMMLAGLCSSLLLGLFSSTFLRNILVELKASSTAPFLIFVLAYLSLTFLLSLLIFGAGIILSHRTAGPFYAFEQYIEDLLEGKDRPFILREGDHYRHLESVASNVREIILKEKGDR
jgi:signal peptidase II